VSTRKTDVRIFGKPTTRVHRRMAVALAYDEVGNDIDQIRRVANEAAAKVQVKS
jgi:phosphoribosylglycinamide formyltransferase 2